MFRNIYLIHLASQKQKNCEWQNIINKRKFRKMFIPYYEKVSTYTKNIYRSTRESEQEAKNMNRYF